MTDFEEWYAKYYGDVYKFTLSLCHNEAEAEELTQNAFFKALNSIDSFKGECSARDAAAFISQPSAPTVKYSSPALLPRYLPVGK